MAFAPGDPLANWIILLEIEVGHRIDPDTWTQAASPNTNAWYISHTSVDEYGEHEGKPSRVKENGAEYTEEDSLADCHSNASTWWWDSSNKRLYVHASGDDDPGWGDYIILSYIWRRFGSKVYKYGGKPYLPFLAGDSVSSIGHAVGGYHEGQAKQTFGAVKLLNGMAYFDIDLSDYIYEGKKAIARVGKDGAAEADFGIFWEGCVGDIEWTEMAVTLEMEDLGSLIV